MKQSRGAVNILCTSCRKQEVGERSSSLKHRKAVWELLATGNVTCSRVHRTARKMAWGPQSFYKCVERDHRLFSWCPPRTVPVSQHSQADFFLRCPLKKIFWGERFGPEFDLPSMSKLFLAPARIDLCRVLVGSVPSGGGKGLPPLVLASAVKVLGTTGNAHAAVAMGFSNVCF